MLEEAGLPGGVVNFCPGSGATFGNAIVEHPKTRFIAFTGSKAVGLDIHERAAKAQPGQIWIKRTILEMGGKDSILVCADADLDAAVEGMVASAFGFSGQKCSACSRVIVEAPIYEVFVERVRERVAQLTVGDPADNPTMGPVVNQAALDSILGYIETGKQEGRLSPAASGGDRRWRLFHPAHGYRRCRARRGDRAGGNLWASAGGHQSHASRRAWRSPTTPSTA